MYVVNYSMCMYVMIQIQYEYHTKEKTSQTSLKNSQSKTTLDCNILCSLLDKL